MTELLAAVAVHELRRVTKLIADHTSVVTAIIFDIVLLDDKGRVELGNLLFVLDDIRRYRRPCYSLVTATTFHEARK
jgi:hypothetical protein